MTLINKDEPRQPRFTAAAGFYHGLQMKFYRVFLMLSWGSFRYINPYSGKIPFLLECVSRQDKFRSYLDYLNIFSLVCKQ
jgi:hypothetical protein